MSDPNIIPLSFEDDSGDEGASQPLSIEGELEQFRKQWCKELNDRKIKSSAVQSATLKSKEPSLEEQAKFLFMQGVNAEQSGKLENAIKYYKRALHLVPDIESKIDDFKPATTRRDRTDSESSNISISSDTLDDEDENEDLDDLIAHFNKLKVTDKTTIKPQWEYRGGHISMLPTELLVHILRWVISSELDVQSLENVSLVCRRLFLCARDEGLWRHICARIWGHHLGSVSQYCTYRTMYIERPHMRYNGLYISQCHYYRNGEKSLDNFYKPVHHIEYYRYARFFPDGKVLMLTSPQDPYQVVPQLRYQNANIQGILTGYYRLVTDTVTCIMKRKKIDYQPNTYRKYKRNKKNNNNYESNEMTFHAEFLLKSAGKRQRAQLSWQQYSAHTKYVDGSENTTNFDVNDHSHTPMIFSRVRCFTADAFSPL